MHGEGEHFAGSFFCLVEGAFPAAAACKNGKVLERYGVVYRVWDAVLFQMCGKAISFSGQFLGDTERVLVIYMRPIGGMMRCRNKWMAVEQAVVDLCSLSTAGMACVEMSEFDLQNGGLDCVEPAIHTDGFVVVFSFGAMV